MSEKKTVRKPLTAAQIAWQKKPWSEKRKHIKNTAEIGVRAAPIELTPDEIDAMTVLNGGANGDLVETLAKGKFAKIALEDGELYEYGRTRTKRAVRFLVSLLNGAKLRDAMKASELTWLQINVFSLVCPEFNEIFQAARGGMKRAMGANVLDTAYELATEGEEQFNNKDGTALGYKKKSEKMLDRLLTLSGKEFSRDGGGTGCCGGDGSGGGITLNFHFDGKGKPSVTAETVDVG